MSNGTMQVLSPSVGAERQPFEPMFVAGFRALSRERLLILILSFFGSTLKKFQPFPMKSNTFTQ